MALDNEIAKQVDKLLDDEESNVLLAFKVSKNQAAWTVAGRRGRVQSKPRVLAVTAKRNQVTQKFSVKIHVLKVSPKLELAKTYKLSTLTSIEAEKSDATGRSFYLVFDQKKDNSLAQWAVRSIDERNQLLVCLLKMSRENLGRMPKVVGIDVVEMALWAQKNAKPLAIGATSVSASHGQKEDGTPAESMDVQQDMVSKVEEDDMEALLDTYVIGIDEAEAFSERLKRELAALEAANVHAILESEALVEEVLDRLDGAAETVEDMDEWLNVFNIKLRHMRDDIDLIEARNNRLEVQSRNNEALLRELDKLLDCLHVPSQYAAILTGGPFDEPNMPETLEACDWLCKITETLEPSKGVEENFTQMRAIREKRNELEKLKLTFVRRASDFLRHFLSAQVETMLTDRKGQLKYPDHKDLRRKCRIYARLIQQIKILDVNALAAVRKSYCQSINLLLRRETREFASDLKAGARGGSKGSAGWDANAASSPANPESAAAADAYSRLLRTILPLLADEALFFAAFLCFDAVPPVGGEGLAHEYADLLPRLRDGSILRPGDADPAEMKELLATLDILFDGIQEDFYSIVDWAYKIDPLRCITMLGQTEQWLASHGDEQGYARKLLTELQTRIRQLFHKYVDEANAQIEKHDRNVKQTGVLSFIPRFAALAAKMESLVVEGSSRDLVDQAYNKLVNTMFKVLEKIALVDPKYADVLLLENYAAFQNSTYDLAGSLPTLRHFYQQASEAYEQACSNYVDEGIKQQFEALFAYQHKIKSLLVTIETEEIPFQIGFSKVDLRKVLKSQLAMPDKSLQAMYQRMKKNLTSGDLLPSLWLKCQEDFMEKYEELEALIAKCYHNETITPSSSEMRELFQEAAV